MRFARAMFLTIGLSAPTGGMAQINPVQILGRSERSAPVSQGQKEGNRVEVPHQISDGQDNIIVAPQLTAADAHNQQVQQITGAPRNAQPFLPISGSGRETASSVDRIAGTDRCDPITRSPEFEDRCSQFLESNPDRLVERDTRQPSPERALLHDDWQLGASEQLENATRRLQSTGNPDGSLVALGVASIVLGATAAQVAPQEKDDDPAEDFATQGILNFLQLPPGP